MRIRSDLATRFLMAGLLAAGLLLPAGAAAAASQQRPAAPPPPRPDAPPPPGMDEELADTIERLLIQRFRRALELSPEQDATVTPLMEKLTEARRSHMRSRREGLRTLSALSQDTAIDESVLEERLQAFYREQEDFSREETKLLGRIRTELTPRQQARLLAFEERFREEIRRRMQDARREGRVRPRRDGPGSGSR